MYATNAQVVYPSSASVYGAVQKLPITETDPLNPASPYGVHKRHAEELCMSYAQHFGIAVSVVRLFSVYGAGLRKQLLWDASQKIMRRENNFFGTGAEVRDWLHVEDAANLLIVAASHASALCPVVNGGSGTGVAVREILVELVSALGGDDAPVFSGITRSGDPLGYVADISRACALGWLPRTPWQDGVREYAAWFKK